MAKLTAKSVDHWANDPKRRLEVRDAAMPGLYLVLQPSGAKGWALRYRHGGKSRKMTLGAYPACGLAEARDQAGRALRTLEVGQDPAQERKAASMAALEAKRAVESNERDKLANVIDEFIKRHASRNRTGAEAAAILRREAIPAWGEKPVQDISRRDVIELLDAKVDAGHPIAANRLRAHLSAFLGWCRGRDIVSEHPVDGTPKPADEKPRDRVLTDSEIKLFWQACDKIGPPFGQLYRLLLVTGQRLREVSEMTEAEITGDIWAIPARRAKGGQDHFVPLTDAAQVIIAKVPRVGGRAGFVFSTTGATPVSGYSRAKNRLDAAMTEIALASGLAAVDNFTIHDLRRTAATGMAGLRIAPHVIEAVLNHRSSAKAGVYNRASYAAEKREALTAWANYIDALVTGRDGSNVVRLAVNG